ncbi:carboxyltransferase domain-containing protein [Pseudonocardia phyllosphaerae]|uniref:carboxyltransferase domain-containing protein n=1 Tax=Pseudonocardia phyllosphaerae TaxID=3390502 RepID=UPI003977F8D4
MTTGAQTGPVPTVSVRPYGDAAVMVEPSDPDPAARRTTVRRLRELLLSRRPVGVLDIVAGLESLLIGFDPLMTGPEHMGWAVRLLAETGHDTIAPTQTPREFVIPMVFGGSAGPDLDEVAEELGLTNDDLVAAVTGSRFTIALLAAAMAPMMDGLQVPRPIRRRAEPRTDVAPGAVMVAGTGAVIQPFPGPSGWRVIGATPHTIVDITRADPAAFTPGDTARFEPLDTTGAAALAGTFLLPEGATR